MKILLVSPHYYPEIVAYVPLIKNLAEDLVSYGHEVTVITGPVIRGVSEQDREAYKNLKEEIIDRVKVIRVGALRGGKRGIVNRGINYLSFTLNTFLKALTVKDYDVIFTASTPPTLGLTGAIVGMLRRKPFVYNLQDLFPQVAIQTGHLKNRLLIRMFESMERFIYQRASLLTVISDGFKEHLSNLKIKDRKIRVLPNWVDTDEIRPVSRAENQFVKQYGLQDSFNVIYSGNVGVSQNIPMVIEAAKSLGKIPEIKFVIVGAGEMLSQYKEYADTVGASNVIFAPFQPHEMIPHVYSAADLSIVTLKKGVSQSSVPSKTWTIMSCATPVLASIDKDSELASLIERIHAGLVVEPDQVQPFANAVLELYSKRSLLREMGDRGRNYVINQLSRKKITMGYNDALESVNKTSWVKVT